MKVYALYITVLIAVLVSSCSDQDPIIENPEELITTVNLTLSPMDNSGDIVFSFTDLDGDGGNEPIIISSNLKSNTTYLAEIELLDESGTTTEDITEEVREEALEHQFFFVVTNANLNITYGDADDNANPIGITSNFITGAAGNGTLQVILRHEPDKFATGVSQGDPTNAGGETDIQVEFPIDIE